jgi:hypothetical protein
MSPALRSAVRWLLVVLTLFNAVSAIPAGISFLLRPDGSWLGTPLEMLQGSPFSDFRVPGLVLALGVGGSSLAAGFLLLGRKALGAAAALGAGVVLAGWIGVQVMMIGGWVFLQVLYLGLGLVMMAGGWALVAAARREA